MNRRQVDPLQQIGPGATIDGCPSGVDVTSCYGYLYNYFTATAGQSYLSAPDEGTLIVGSICPASWHLPTGYGVDSDISVLNASMQLGSLANGSIENFYENWLPTGQFRGALSGVYDGIQTGQGSVGNYWTANVRNTATAYKLRYESGNVYLNNQSDYRRHGNAVRCLADNTQELSITFGGVPATIVSHNDTEIVVIAPPHTAGTVDITIAIGADSITMPNAYTYDATFITVSSDDEVTFSATPGLESDCNRRGEDQKLFIEANTNSPDGLRLYLSTVSTTDNRLHKESSSDSIRATNQWDYLDTNSWGYTDTLYGDWYPVPTASIPAEIGSSNAPGIVSPNIYINACVDASISSGDYRTEILITAVGNL